MNGFTANLALSWVNGLHRARYASVKELDIGSLPDLILGLLPRKTGCGTLKEGAYRRVRVLVECVEKKRHDRCLSTHVARDPGKWIAAVQRAQCHSLQLLEPLRLLNACIEDGTLKLRGLPSREFGTLASVCAKARCPEARELLERFSEHGLLEAMLPELRNSDFALFLTAMAQANMIDRLETCLVRSEFLRRIHKMGTFEIAVALDAFSRLRWSEPGVMDVALKRFAHLTAHSDEYCRRSPLRKIKSMGRSFQCRSQESEGPRHVHSRSMETGSINNVSLFLRGIARADAVNSSNIGCIVAIAAYINSIPHAMLEKIYRDDPRMPQNCTTLIGSLCYVLSRNLGSVSDHSTIDRALMKLMRSIVSVVGIETFSLKDRTKLCLAVYAYWHLAAEVRVLGLLRHVYDTIVNEGDPFFREGLGGKGKKGTSGRMETGILQEIWDCLLNLPGDRDSSSVIRTVVVPPYRINVIGTPWWT